MANTIKLKRGTSTPSTSDISNGEVAIDTSAKKLYINDSGTVKEIGGSGSVGGASGLDFNDDVKVRFGTGNDLEIYHDGSHSYIKDTGTGELRLASSQFTVQNAASNETLLYAVENGSVGLKYDDSLKLETKSYGLSLHGNVLMTNTDNQQLKLGAANDLIIYHDGTDSRIHNSTGRLVTRSATESCWYNAAGNEVQAKFIIDGAVELYYDNSLQFKTTANGCQIDGDLYFDNEVNAGRDLFWDQSADYLKFSDNVQAVFGNGTDLQIYHDGTDSFVKEATGDLWLQSTADDIIIRAADNIVLQPQAGENGINVSGNGSVDLYYDGVKKFETLSNGCKITDSDTTAYLTFTNSAGNNGYVMGEGTDIIGFKDTNPHWLVKATKDAAVELYYDNSKKLETTSTGATLTGALITTQLNVTNGLAANLTTSGYDILVGDSTSLIAFRNRARFGDGEDLQLFHNGTHSYVQNTTGSLLIESGTTVLRSVSQENYLVGTLNGSVELYYDNSKKFETTSTGITVTGSDTTGSIFKGDIRLKKTTDDDTQIKWDVSHTKMEFMDSVIAAFGAGNDLQIYHSGTQSYISDQGTGNLNLQGSSKVVIGNAAHDENMAQFFVDGAVELYYDNSKKFETTSTGVTVTGNVNLAADNNSFTVGAGQDLQIYHDGTNNILRNVGTRLDVIVNSSETAAVFNPNTSVDLYYDNSKKFETTSTGAKVNGSKLEVINTSGAGDSQLYLEAGEGGTAFIQFIADNGDDNTDKSRILQADGANLKIQNYDSGSWATKLETTSTGISITGNISLPSGHLYVSDSQKLMLGTSDDLQLFHDGSNSYISDVGTGFLSVQGSEVHIRGSNDENGIKVITNGRVELFYDNAKHFETTATGVSWGTTRLRCDDNGMIELGTGQDLQIYHDGSNSYLVNGTGALIIRGAGGSDFIHLEPKTDENGILIKPDGAVELYYDNSKKFETTSAGVTIDGDATFTGVNYNIFWDKSANALKFTDNSKAIFGDHSGTGDLHIYHDGTDSYIDNSTNELIVKTGSNFVVKVTDGAEKTIKGVTNGAVELYYDNAVRFQTTSGGVLVSGALESTGLIYSNNNDIKTGGDTGKLMVGASNDLQIYHNGTDSYLKNTTNDLYIHNTGDDTYIIATDDIYLKNGDDWAIKCIGDGAVELYYDNAKTFTTSANAGIVWGTEGNNATLFFHADEGDDWADYWNLTATTTAEFKLQCRADGGGFETSIESNRNGNVELYYDNVKMLETYSNGVKLPQGTNSHLWLTDNGKAMFGTGTDLSIYHDGSNSYIDNTTGILRIRDSEIRLCNTDNETYFMGAANAAAKLYFDDSVKLETASYGTYVSGRSKADNFGINDAGKYYAGTGDDLQIWHDGSHSYIRQTNTGWLYLDVQSGKGTFCNTDSTTSTNLTLKKTDSGANGVDYFQCRNDNNGLYFVIEGDGDAKNYNNSWGSTSDVKLKENIVDANSQWEDIKAVKVRNFNFKASTGFPANKHIGVIAQELETISPGLVSESIDRDPDTDEDLGTKTKSVKTSILYMKAVKALQEAMARIETLETKVAALESA